MSIKLLSLFHALGERFELLGSVEIINSQLIGTGSCIPDFVLTNAMLETMVDTSDEWIVKRTGVRERRIAKNTQHLGARPRRGAERAGGRRHFGRRAGPHSGQHLHAGHQHPEHCKRFAGQAGRAAGGRNRYQQRLRGLCFRNRYRGQLHQGGQSQDRAGCLGETLHRITDYTDRSTCILFGDGAAAAVTAQPEMRTSASSPPLSRRTARVRSIYTWRRCRSRIRSQPSVRLTPRRVSSRCRARQSCALPRMPYRWRLNTALQRAGVSADEIDWVVPHQANLRNPRRDCQALSPAQRESLSQYGPLWQHFVRFCADLSGRNAEKRSVAGRADYCMHRVWRRPYLWCVCTETVKERVQ